MTVTPEVEVPVPSEHPQTDALSQLFTTSSPDLTELIRVCRGFEKDVNTWRLKYHDRFEKHNKDIQIIGEELIKVAEDRGWCSDYDAFIDSLNDRLNIDLPVRSRDWEVAVDITETRIQRVVITVTATDEDDAYDMAYELVCNDSDDYINSYNWDLQDTQIEVNEVRRA